MGLKLLDMRGMRERRGDAGGDMVMYPTEQHMMELAQKWSLDPSHLEPGSAEPALGVIARVPSSWRPERLSPRRTGRLRPPVPSPARRRANRPARERTRRRG